MCLFLEQSGWSEKGIIPLWPLVFIYCHIWKVTKHFLDVIFFAERVMEALFFLRSGVEKKKKQSFFWKLASLFFRVLRNPSLP